ncbi:zinc-binding protein A33-like [Trichomycterus rosablanca]|uniref:zinc-binding protein A33-like n=1 Tax=Trichomycterus rosablanca TaxID=2290929 RepID=UPI002F3579AB
MESTNEHLSEHLRCGICKKIYTDPVILPCSHSFCRACLDKTLNQKGENKCRRCNKAAKRPYIGNQDLKAVCEEIKKRRNSAENEGLVCLVHVEKCVMFCNDDQKLVCSNCMDQDHRKHTFYTIPKVAEDYRNQLERPLQKLETKLEDLNSKKSLYESKIPELQDQTKQVEKQINEEFEKLHEFLTEEQKNRVDALRKEEKEKICMLDEKIVEIRGWISDLSKRLQDLKTIVGGDNSHFIRTFKETETRLKLPVPDPQLPSGHRIDEVKHSRNLRFRVWEKMKDVSPNLKKNKHHWHILGSEGYDSGTHAWEVEVDQCEYWFLGVVKESAKEEENQSNCPLSLSSLKAEAMSPGIKKVRVVLDIVKGQVTFTDHDGNTVLKTQAQDFREKMYPGFITVSDHPLKIVPAKVSVSV